MWSQSWRVFQPGKRLRCAVGLELYYRYHTVLQLAKNCNDPQLNRSLSVRLLDCTDMTVLQAMTPEELADPNLPEVSRDEQGI